MATQKQRRRRAKEKRHDYELVYVDEDGVERPVREGGHPGSRLGAAARGLSRRPRSRLRGAGRGGRTAQPPSWRKVLKRGAIFAPIFFATVLLLGGEWSTDGDRIPSGASISRRFHDCTRAPYRVTGRNPSAAPHPRAPPPLVRCPPPTSLQRLGGDVARRRSARARTDRDEHVRRARLGRASVTPSSSTRAATRRDDSPRTRRRRRTVRRDPRHPRSLRSHREPRRPGRRLWRAGLRSRGRADPDRGAGGVHAARAHGPRGDTPDVWLDGGETIDAAGITFAVTAVPGHSPAHVAYFADGELFSGDVLFAGSVGRTDLPGSDWATLDRVDRDRCSTRTRPDDGASRPRPETTLGPS